MEISLTVTDTFGCVSTCVTTLDCEFVFDNTLQDTPPSSNSNAGKANNGISSENVQQQLSLHPNPTSGSINLRFESLQEEEVEYSVMNLLGGLIFQEKFMSQKGLNTHQVDVSHVQEGSYLMKLVTKTATHTKVFVIMRND